MLRVSGGVLCKYVRATDLDLDCVWINDIVNGRSNIFEEKHLHGE